jgi:DNA-binding transcriptional ArsR family regulator
MVENGSARLDQVFHALSDPTRRSLLRRLSDGERSVGELASHYDVTLNSISKHLKVLTEAELVVRRKSGRRQFLHLNPGPLGEAHRWLQFYQAFWSERLDALATFVEETSRE